MTPRQNRCIFLTLCLIVVPVALTCVMPVYARTDAPQKEIVTDGRYVHNVGNLDHNVTNWGLLGSTPNQAGNVPWADAPSAQWPAQSGNEYLWAAGLWVGGVRLGERLVSTGAFRSEFRPTDAVADSIHVTATGAFGGARYPWPGADDDGDGVEDEEILNGIDDDGDGAIDEDFAAWGDQHFVATYRDDDPSVQEQLPDHTPLGIEVVQQSVQWSNPLGEDFVGYDFTITNQGVVSIEDLYLGMFSDFDIGPRGLVDVASDDYAGSWVGTIRHSSGEFVPVELAYMWDGADHSPLPGYIAWVLCGHTTDPEGVTAPAAVSLRTFQRFSGQASFAQGGDPTNDEERYSLMSAGPDEWDSDTLPGMQSDYRVLTSSGPFTSLEPGESLHYAVALVAGIDLDELLAHAAEAVMTYRGVNYDRDGDPANGDEYAVHWLRDDEAPVSSMTGSLRTLAVAGGVEISIDSNGSADELSVYRPAGIGLAERVWQGGEFESLGGDGHSRSFRLEDHEAGAWPRTYRLIYTEDDWQQTLAEVTVELPGAQATELLASPNPFNPQVNFRLTAQASDHAVLRVFDVRGRRITTLLDGPWAGGTETLTWRGTDDAGHSVPSGVYVVRLEAGREIAHTRITLLR